MNTPLSIPFFSNTPDNTHCFQASLRMVLKYFEPTVEYSWEQLDALTGKKENLWTWPLAALVWMKHHGYDVVNVEMMDYDRLVKEREQYILEFYGQEAGTEQIRHSDIAQEVVYAQQLLQEHLVIRGVPTIETIRESVNTGFLVVCLINAQTLNQEPGYVGHFVVVTQVGSDTITLHDPGLPAQENRTVPLPLFEKSWACPDENAKCLMAFRKK